MTTTSSRAAISSQTGWSGKSQPSQRPSTTPKGRSAQSVSQVASPLLTPTARNSSSALANNKSSSPSYFGLVVEEGSNPIDSDAGRHAKKNWNSSASSARPAASSAGGQLPLEHRPELENFRRESEVTQFRLGHGNLSRFGTSGRIPTLGSLQKAEEDKGRTLTAGGVVVEDGLGDKMEVDSHDEGKNQVNKNPSFFGLPSRESPRGSPSVRPSLTRNPLSTTIDERHPRLSLPNTKLTMPPDLKAMPSLQKARAETLPSKMDTTEGPTFISSHDLRRLMEKTSDTQYLLLDVRVAPQYAQARISGALNLCIPTTLLKRPAFNIQKLTGTFSIAEEKVKFSNWPGTECLIAYDASSIQLKDATTSINTLKKFANEKYSGELYILRGGYNDFNRQFPECIERPAQGLADGKSGLNLTIDSKGDGMQVAGGCPMPAAKSAAHPFFGSIRQNMDLVDGVGQMPLKRPQHLTNSNMRGLPSWLRDAADEEDNGKQVSERFLRIERDEQARMQKALSGQVQYGTPQVASEKTVQIAGIEKGQKNRYKDMLPYDHTRVRLQDVPHGECDYINASYVKAEWSHKRYIATQAPVPATFPDFWRLVWEQDVRAVIMLTAESENGQRKSHPYWQSESHGPYKVKMLSEQRLLLDRPGSPNLLNPTRKASLQVKPVEQRPGIRRRATNPHGFDAGEIARDVAPPASNEPPFCIVRKLTVNDVRRPFEPLREITQVQYTSWPDFGAPAESTDVLGLVETCDRLVRSQYYRSDRDEESKDKLGKAEGGLPVTLEEGQRPCLVHCSAGCGRTGTFVTVDTVIDMLKRQRMVMMDRHKSPKKTAIIRKKSSDDDDHDNEMDIDDKNEEGAGHGDGDALNSQEWVSRDDLDLVEKTVDDLRTQRLSMVQNLRQFTLCYESILEWLVGEMPAERFRREGFRKSFQG